VVTDAPGEAVGEYEAGAVAAMSLPAPTGLPPDRNNRLIWSKAWASSTSSCSQPSTSSGSRPAAPTRTRQGFPFGGWQAPLLDEVAAAQIGAAYEGTDALLLGRRTYDIFAAYWPHQEGGEIATLFNSVPKYVASRGRPDLSWAGSTQLGPDLAGAVREIRDRHEHVKVVGSLNLVQTLLREKLFDRLDLWVHPIVLGVGKKVFEGGAVPTNVTLLEPPVADPKGTVYLRYGLADGTPGTGDMSAPDRGAGRDD
jgi:dihydrofolate reductase